MKNQSKSKDANPDPITGAPGSHPVETGVGTALGGAAAGAVGGAVAGPVGAVVGAVAGGLAGGFAGKEVGEQIDPTAEDAYWSENYRSRSYVAEGDTYSTYKPAYEYGWESRSRFHGRRFDDVEPELQKGWSSRSSSMSWDRAKFAARDAWDRVERALPGDADRDGK